MTDVTKVLQACTRRWWIIAAVAVVMLLSYALVLRYVHQYTATTTVLLLNDTAAGLQNGTNESTRTSVALSSNDVPRVLTTNIVLERTARDLGLPPTHIGMLSTLHARVSFDTNILPVSFTASDADLAVRGANMAAMELSRYSREIVRGRYDSLILELTKQLQDTNAKLSVIDRKLQSKLNADPFLDIANGTAPISSELQQLELSRNQAQASMMADKAQSAITNQRLSSLRPLADGELLKDDPTYGKLNEQYSTDAAHLADIRAKYSQNYPGAGQLKAIIDRDAVSLANRSSEILSRSSPAASLDYSHAITEVNQASAIYDADRARVAAIDDQINTVQQHLATSASDGVSVAELRRNRQSDEQTMSSLSQRLAETIADQSRAGSTGIVTVIDPAVSASSVIWTTPRVLSVAFLALGLWLAVSLAVLIDRLDKRLDSVDDVETFYGRPVIATVGAH